MSRLSHALDAGAVELPEFGPVAVVDPPLGYDLAALPMDRVIVVSPNALVHAEAARLGVPADVTLPQTAAVSIVVAGKSKSRTRGNIASASLAAAPIIVDGDKTAGTDALYRDLKKLVSVTAAHAKAHGKVFGVSPGDELTAWLAKPNSVDGFRTWPGVFSEDKIDRGSALLADTLQPLKGRVADLGSGWGYLSARVLEASPDITTLHMVEADAHAVTCARENVTDPRAHHHWADATEFEPGEPIDHVVTNPPFHTGRAAEPVLGQSFIVAAGRMLTPKGTLWLVANRQLPYEGVLRDTFREVEEIAGDPTFKVFCARRPR